jgi:hypothetical protein
MIISWKTSVSTRHVVINNFKIISIKLIKIRTKGTNLFTQYSSLGYLLFLSFIRRKSMLGKRKMTFLFLFFILFTRAAGGLFLSMSQLYKYWTIRRRRKKREKILEHSSTWFDCNEAHPMIKLMPKRNCTTGFISKKKNFLHTCSFMNCTNTFSGLIWFFFSLSLHMSEVMMRPLDTNYR